MQFVTNGMSQGQIEVLRESLRLYETHSIDNANKARDVNDDLRRMWQTRALIARDMREGIK